MSLAQRAWSLTGSTDSPMTLQFRLANSGSSFARAPSSVVHTGVKSLGCENSMPQESPSHSWNRIRPWVVSASKSGALSPIRSDIDVSLSGVPPAGEFSLRLQDAQQVIQAHRESSSGLHCLY